MPHGRKHVYPSPTLNLPGPLHEDRHRLEEVAVPIVTISASFRRDIMRKTGESLKSGEDIVFSRAHYSMAMALFVEAKERGLNTWLVDPTNYVADKDWKKLLFVEKIGKLTARIPLLKKLKDLAESLIRSNLPITQAIKKPLLYVTERTKEPILSLHYEAGNILAEAGRRVIQVITDPHVRPNYLYEAERSNIQFCVFNEATKLSFFSLAKEMNKNLSEDKVIVTGPPVDPRIIAVRRRKIPTNWKKRGLNIVIATSGLGTNYTEIKSLLDQLLPILEEKNINLILYSGTHSDFKDMYYNFAKKYNLKAGDVDSNARIRVIHEESIIAANQHLIDYAFPWSDMFITKPSGDMAYDAVAAGCCLLTLTPWGEWEEKIEEIFTKLNICQKVDLEDFADQLSKLIKDGWIEKTMKSALDIDELFLRGTKNIVDLQQKLALQ